MQHQSVRSLGIALTIGLLARAQSSHAIGRGPEIGIGPLGGSGGIGGLGGFGAQSSARAHSWPCL
jgi:hypothetical protein